MTIKQARKHKNLTQKQLADLCDIHVQQISDWERGHRNVSPENLIKIANALDMSIRIDPKTQAFEIVEKLKYDAYMQNERYNELVYAKLTPQGWKIFTQNEEIPDGCLETSYAEAFEANELNLMTAIANKLKL